MAVKLGKQLTAYDEHYMGVPIDKRSVVDTEQDISDILYAYVGMPVSTKDGGFYEVTAVDENSFPISWSQLATSNALSESLRNGLDNLRSDVANDIATNIASNKDEIISLYTSTLQEELQASRDQFNSIAAEVAQEVQQHLEETIALAQGEINDAKLDIENAKNQLDAANEIINQLTESSGSVNFDIDELAGRLETTAAWADVTGRTYSTCQSLIDAQNAVMQNRVDYIDTQYGKVNTAIQTLCGETATLREAVSSIDTTGNVKTEVEQYLNGEEGRAYLSASVTDLTTNTVTQALQDYNVVLGKVVDQLYKYDGETGELNDISTIKELSESGSPVVSTMVSTLDKDGDLSFSDIKQTTSALTLLVEQVKSGNTLAAGIAILMNNSDSTVEISADKIALLGETVAEKFNALDVTVNNGATHFSQVGSGYTANGNIKWNADGSGQIGTSGSVISWDTGGTISMRVQLSQEDKNEIASSIGGVTAESLKDTGIDIANKVIALTSDNFKVENNRGETTLCLDSDGTLISNGGIFDDVVINGSIISTPTYINLSSIGKVGTGDDIIQRYVLEETGEAYHCHCDEGEVTATTSGYTEEIMIKQMTFLNSFMKEGQNRQEIYSNSAFCFVHKTSACNNSPIISVLDFDILSCTQNIHINTSFCDKRILMLPYLFTKINGDVSIFTDGNNFSDLQLKNYDIYGYRSKTTKGSSHSQLITYSDLLSLVDKPYTIVNDSTDEYYYLNAGKFFYFADSDISLSCNENGYGRDYGIDKDSIFGNDKNLPQNSTDRVEYQYKQIYDDLDGAGTELNNGDGLIPILPQQSVTITLINHPLYGFIWKISYSKHYYLSLYNYYDDTVVTQDRLINYNILHKFIKQNKWNIPNDLMINPDQYSGYCSGVSVEESDIYVPFMVQINSAHTMEDFIGQFDIASNKPIRQAYGDAFAIDKYSNATAFSPLPLHKSATRIKITYNPILTLNFDPRLGPDEESESSLSNYYITDAIREFGVDVLAEVIDENGSTLNKYNKSIYSTNENIVLNVAQSKYKPRWLNLAIKLTDNETGYTVKVDRLKTYLERKNWVSYDNIEGIPLNDFSEELISLIELTVDF